MEDDYENVAKFAWHSSSNKPFHCRTTNLAGTLKKWCKKKKPLQQQLDTLQEQINTIQKQPIQDQDHSLEVKLISQYEDTMTKLTEFYRQRSKKHWAVHGDRNTSYFHSAVRKRQRRNRIVSIKDEHGRNLFDPDDIAHEFVHYFKSIFHSSGTNNGRPLFSTSCPQGAQDFTNSIPDKQEVWEILKAMKKDASPGPDGFNVAFYTSAWSWIGDDVTNLVRNFYIIGILPPGLNDTNIAVIPKSWFVICHRTLDQLVFAMSFTR
jgi:hypothetical protein